MNKELDEFIRDSERCLEQRREDLDRHKNNIIKYIQDKVLNEIDLKNIIIQGRVKGKESLREKIIRKDYYTSFRDNPEELISSLPDLIGIRIVCLLEKEEKVFFEELNKLFSRTEGNNLSVLPNEEGSIPRLRINKLNQPDEQKNGLKLYKMKSQWIVEDKIINVEIQIKSLIHMFWGEIEHMLFYKNYVYNVGQDFYVNFMKSTLDVLHTMDYQLEIIKKQLSLKTDEEIIEELKQMVTRLVYNTYHPEICSFVGCDIDLKEVYEMIVLLYFGDVDEKTEALDKTNAIISILNSSVGKLEKEHLEFIEDYEEPRSFITREVKELAKGLAVLIRGNDVFWKALCALYKIIFKQRDFSKAANKLSEHFMDSFVGLGDEFDEADAIHNELSLKGIYDGIIKSFSKYKKLDFFSPSTHQTKIFDSLTTFIRAYKEEIADIKQEEFNGESSTQFLGLMTVLTELEISTVINKQIEVSTLKELSGWIKNNNVIWIPSNLNIAKLEEHIESDNPISKTDYRALYEKEEV